MKLKLDVKTLVVGIALGVIITVVLGAGAGSADADRFGIAVGPQGSALVRTSNGEFYIVSPENGMATKVLIRRSLNDTPLRNRDSLGRHFSLSSTSRPVKPLRNR